MITTTLKAGLVATAIAIAASTPASAGSFTFSLTARGDSADLIRSGLQIYGMVNEVQGKNHAKGEAERAQQRRGRQTERRRQLRSRLSERERAPSHA